MSLGAPHFISYGRLFFDWCRRKARERGMPWVFSHAVVPVLVGCWILPSLLELRPFVAPHEMLAAVPFRSRLTQDGHVEETEALLVLLENAPYELALTWPGENVDVMTSLDSSLLSANSEKISRTSNGLWVRMPPTGHSELVAFFAAGALSDEILVETRSVDLPDLNIVSRQSVGVAMASFGAALFGFGLVLSSVRNR